MANYLSLRALIAAVVLAALALPSSLLSTSIQRLTADVLTAVGYEPVFATPTSYNISAITTRDGASIIQCWQFIAPLTVSTQTGIAGAALQNLGLTEKAIFGYVPAKYPGSPHPAPAVQYVAYLAGQCEITFPGSKERAVFGVGAESIIIAADTPDKTKLGHVSRSLDQPLAALQIPIKGGVIPDHKVLHDGQCRADELQLLIPRKYWW